MYHCGLLVVLLYHALDVVGGASQSEIRNHLELGRDFLAKGQLQDALTHYHAAVDGDRNNFLTYYKRGTVYLGLGKANLALADFDKVLEIKPDFVPARIQRGAVLLKQADFDLAEENIKYVLAAEPDNEEAMNIYSKIEPTRESYRHARSLIDHKSYEEAIDMLTHVIEVCPWSSSLRELRAEAYEALGDYMSVVSDLRLTTKLRSDNTAGFHKLSVILHRIGHVDEALKEIRECLKLDPEHMQCFPFYKKIRKISKYLNDANAADEARFPDTCINSANKIIAEEEEYPNVQFLAHHLLCKCYRYDDKATLAMKHCQEALKISRDVNILCDSVEAYLAAELYDDAIREAKEALEIDSSSQRAKELLQKSQQRQKLSESRDYYKILQVPRTATKQEIVKAYRRQAQIWHPDNFKDEEKKRAEKKFLDIAAAKEVLTDKEKKAIFDRGEDPLDPESGMHGAPHFRDFHQFHGGGSPFQFKFHFN